MTHKVATGSPPLPPFSLIVMGINLYLRTVKKYKKWLVSLLPFAKKRTSRIIHTFEV
jgi:hypothetical protein